MFQIPLLKIVRASRRSISIQISKTQELVVRAPFSVPEDIIHAFVDRKSDWIEKHMTLHLKHTEQKNNTLHYLGQPYSFEYNLLQKESVLRSEGFFAFSSKVHDAASEQAVITHWYRKEARQYLSERVEYFANKYNLHYQEVSITSATTRWGSCSGNNTINFPWRLMMAPVEVIDYVVVHELAHTVHKNHSDRFWGLVESIMPEWKLHRAHLREEGGKYVLPVF